MKQLKQGTSVPLTNGTNAVVKKLLGEGGQGSVYLASINGKDYALKIYAKKPSPLFRKNMAENIRVTNLHRTKHLSLLPLFYRSVERD